MRSTLLGAVMLCVSSAGAQGQTCMGTAIKPGALAIGGGASFGDASKSYWLGADGHQKSRILWNAALGITDFEQIENNGIDVSGALGYEALKSSQFSVCPRGSGGYSWWNYSALGAQADVNALYGSLGIGIAADIPTESGFGIGVFAIPVLTIQRTALTVSGNAQYDGSDTQTDTAFGSSFGISLGFSRAYLTGFTSLSTSQGSKPIFGVAIGFVIH